MKRLHIYLHDESLDHLDLLARNRGRAKADMLRELLEQALKNYPIEDEHPIDGHPTSDKRG